MFATSLPASLDHGGGVPGLAIAMVLIGLGVGGVKATISPFLGESFLTRDDRKLADIPVLKPKPTNIPTTSPRSWTGRKGRTQSLEIEHSLFSTYSTCFIGMSHMWVRDPRPVAD